MAKRKVRFAAFTCTGSLSTKLIPKYSVRIWEQRFRRRLARIVQENPKMKDCRIALPFGDQGKFKNWNTVRLLGEEGLLNRAKLACGGSELRKKPDVIGFSDGANYLRRLGCSTLKATFSEVTIIGATHSKASNKVRKCAKVIDAHAVPATDVLAESLSGPEDQFAGDVFSQKSSRLVR